MYFDTKLDTDGGNPKLTVNSLTKLEIILEENDLCDIFEVQNPYVRHLLNKKGWITFVCLTLCKSV